MNSLGFYRVIGESKFTMEYYLKIFQDIGFINSLIFTTKIAVIASVISLILSIGVLFILYINMKERYFYPKIVEKLMETPLFVPYLIGGYGILICFMQSGLLSELCIKLGIIKSYKEFPILTNDRAGIGIIITYIWKTIPFIVLTSTPILKRILNKWSSLSKIFKVGDREFFLKIALPIMGPNLIISFFIIFSYFLVSFEAPYILGVTNPKSLAVYIFDQYTRGALEERGVVMAMNIITLILNLFFGGIIYLVTKKLLKNRERGWE